MDEYQEVSWKCFAIRVGKQLAETHLILFTAASLSQDLIIFHAAKHNIIINRQTVHCQNMKYTSFSIASNVKYHKLGNFYV